MIKISIITVVYNNSKYIQSAINSVKSQTYRNIEHIVVDGGSTDGTLEILNNNSNHIDLLISERDAGIYDAMNKGILLSTGDIIGIINSDDQFYSINVISDIAAEFGKNGNIDALIGNVLYVDDFNKVRRQYLSVNFKRWMMRFGFMPAHTATFVSRNFFNKIGFYSLAYSISSDFDWFCRAFNYPKFNVKFINSFLVIMRLGGVSSSGIRSVIKITNEMMIILKKNHIYSNYFFLFIRLPIKYISSRFRAIF